MTIVIGSRRSGCIASRRVARKLRHYQSSQRGRKKHPHIVLCRIVRVAVMTRVMTAVGMKCKCQLGDAWGGVRSLTHTHTHTRRACVRDTIIRARHRSELCSWTARLSWKSRACFMCRYIPGRCDSEPRRSPPTSRLLAVSTSDWTSNRLTEAISDRQRQVKFTPVASDVTYASG